MKLLHVRHAFAAAGGLALCAGLMVVAPSAPALAAASAIPLAVQIEIQLLNFGTGVSDGFIDAAGPAGS